MSSTDKFNTAEDIHVQITQLEKDRLAKATDNISKPEKKWFLDKVWSLFKKKDKVDDNKENEAASITEEKSEVQISSEAKAQADAIAAQANEAMKVDMDEFNTEIDNITDDLNREVSKDLEIEATTFSPDKITGILANDVTIPDIQNVLSQYKNENWNFVYYNSLVKALNDWDLAWLQAGLRMDDTEETFGQKTLQALEEQVKNISATREESVAEMEQKIADIKNWDENANQEDTTTGETTIDKVATTGAETKETAERTTITVDDLKNTKIYSWLLKQDFANTLNNAAADKTNIVNNLISLLKAWNIEDFQTAVWISEDKADGMLGKDSLTALWNKLWVDVSSLIAAADARVKSRREAKTDPRRDDETLNNPDIHERDLLIWAMKTMNESYKTWNKMLAWWDIHLAKMEYNDMIAAKKVVEQNAGKITNVNELQVKDLLLTKTDELKNSINNRILGYRDFVAWKFDKNNLSNHITNSSRFIRWANTIDAWWVQIKMSPGCVESWKSEKLLSLVSTIIKKWYSISEEFWAWNVVMIRDGIYPKDNFDDKKLLNDYWLAGPNPKGSLVNFVNQLRKNKLDT